MSELHNTNTYLQKVSIPKNQMIKKLKATKHGIWRWLLEHYHIEEQFNNHDMINSTIPQQPMIYEFAYRHYFIWSW
jgi:hypothetical protein